MFLLGISLSTLLRNIIYFCPTTTYILSSTRLQDDDKLINVTFFLSFVLVVTVMKKERESKLKNICNVNVARIARKRKARKSEEARISASAYSNPLQRHEHVQSSGLLLIESKYRLGKMRSHCTRIRIHLWTVKQWFKYYLCSFYWYKRTHWQYTVLIVVEEVVRSIPLEKVFICSGCMVMSE